MAQYHETFSKVGCCWKRIICTENLLPPLSAVEKLTILEYKRSQRGRTSFAMGVVANVIPFCWCPPVSLSIVAVYAPNAQRSGGGEGLFLWCPSRDMPLETC